MEEAIDQALRRIEELRQYRRDLLVIRLFVVAFLIVSLMSPTLAAVGLSIVATLYANVYRRHIGWRWVLFPLCFAALHVTFAALRAIRL